ncbi:MAG TPA: DUF1385 domain-containing protein [Firmicutes bacterium]|nr:DUF1385 domain-containing protein [Bacillota bacterium]
MRQDFQYGGQAVIEGVMMRGRDHIAVAVRKGNGEITVMKRPLNSALAKNRFLRLPIIRGVVVLIESLVIGIQALMYSANEFAGEEEDMKLKPWETTAAMIGAFALFVGLFVILPNFIAAGVQRLGAGPIGTSASEGISRIVIFLLYIFGVSRIKDIKRVFEYHGAEHKVIYTYEAQEELSVENARKYSTLHPRCGTSFLLIVMVVMILIFSLIGSRTLLVRLGLRLILLPVVAGISYEFIKLSGRRTLQRATWFRWLIAPGLWLQRLTTREPDDSQLEVAIKALTMVLEDSSAS